MDKQAILEKIIASNGSCTWASESICRLCPLGKIPREDRSDKAMSCVEALSIDGLSEEDADAKYKAAAEEKLASLLMQQNIEAD